MSYFAGILHNNFVNVIIRKTTNLDRNWMEFPILPLGKVGFQLIYKLLDMFHKLKIRFATTSIQPLPYQFHNLDKIYQIPTRSISHHWI